MKWDGYRSQLIKDGDRVVVLSRNGKEFTGRFSGVWGALRDLPAKSAIKDAEIVACREDGAPDFRALHSGNYSDDVLCAWCFDLMELNGVDLKPLPLMARKMKLGTRSSGTITGRCAIPSLSEIQKSSCASAVGVASRGLPQSARMHPTGQADATASRSNVPC